MTKIKLITDSGSDISWEKAEKLGIRMLPISFTFDGETYYREGIDMTKEEFFSKLAQKDSPIPKTAQVTPVQFADAFNEEMDNGYDTLIVVTISSAASGMHQNAVMMAQEVMEERGGEIVVIDSHGFSCMYGGAVVHAAHMLNEGKGKDEILAYFDDVIGSMKPYFLVGDLEHLKKGGRINTATLVIASMLDINPLLTVKDGLVVQKDKIRGGKNLLKKLVKNIAADGYNLSGKTIFIAHSAMEEKASDVISEIESEFAGAKFLPYCIGPVIGCHGGPDLIGVIFSDKYNFEDYED